MLAYNLPYISLFIVLGFLFITLILSLYSSRNIKSFKEYVVGNYNNKNKGIYLINRSDNKEKKRKTSGQNEISTIIIKFIPTPTNVYNYLNYQFVKNGCQNVLFGIYCCINFIFPYFIWNHKDINKLNIMTGLRLIGALMAGLFIVKDQWKNFLKPYFPIFWYFSLTFCLPFITTIMYLLSDGSITWLVNISISIFFLAILTSTELFLILVPLGVGLAIFFYSYYIIITESICTEFNINFLLIYQILFSSLIALIFLERKKRLNNKNNNKLNNLALSLCSKIKDSTDIVLPYTQMVNNKFKIIQNSNLKIKKKDNDILISEHIYKATLENINVAITLNKDSLNILENFETFLYEKKKLIENPNSYSLKVIIKGLLKKYNFRNIKTNFKNNDDINFSIPKSFISFIISSLLNNAKKDRKASKIELKIIKNKLYIIDNGQKEMNDIKTDLGFIKEIVRNFQIDLYYEYDDVNSSNEIILHFT
ncbi:MAG: hypothetical protein GY830_07515 [Bacteroidetes bacterium]|nr:hypothetical protein [Bacteroidota bacterium]